MHHPFINNLSDKNLEELQTIITGLNSKLSFAYRMQNQTMINQLNMALESYKSEYNKRMEDMYKKQNIENRIQVTAKK